MISYNAWHSVGVDLQMSDNSNNVHFSGVRFICGPYLAIKSAIASLCNDKMQATNEPSTPSK